MKNHFSVAESLAQESAVIDARDKKVAIKCIQDRQKAIMKPIMLAAAILDPANVGTSLTDGELMGSVEFAFNSAKNIGIDQEIFMTQLTNYRSKIGVWGRDFL